MAATSKERACAATKHVSCYAFEVANIRLVSPVASDRAGAGWNRIQLFFGESALDSPNEPASFKTACVLARYTGTGDKSVKVPLTGRLALPPWAWQDPAEVKGEYRASIGGAGPSCGAVPGGATHCDSLDRCLDPQRRLCVASSCVCPDGSVGSIGGCP